VDSLGSLEGPLHREFPLMILYGTVVDPSIAHTLMDVDESKVNLIEKPRSAQIEEELSEDKQEIQTSTPSKPADHKPERNLPRVPAQQKAPSEPSPTSQDTSLRVQVQLLEALMNLAGELVLSRNQLLEALGIGETRAVQASAQRINLVTSELQEAIMQTRMQSIGNIFNKFPRVVRDLAKSLGKEVRLDLSGKEVEMDKTIIEGLSDPLTHMVRNSVDHGIETPDVRKAQGKDPVGQVQLSAYHEAGQVVIEISDDGKGIDVDRIAAGAVSRGLMTQEQVRAMSKRELLSLIFLPGMSTAEKVTDVSGRGVGMDVVKTNLDRLGGTVEIETAVGGGSKFRIRLPLTLAIIPCLLVSCENQRFAIPQVGVQELIRIPVADIQKRIETVGEAQVLLLRDTLVPIVHLAEVLGIERTYYDPKDGLRKPDRRENLADRRSRKQGLFESAEIPSDSEQETSENRLGSDRRYRADSDLNIVIVSAGPITYGLVVERLHETVEIVVKPLGKHLKSLKEYAGATIMGDGRVALILDVGGLASIASLNSVGGSTRAQELHDARSAESLADTQTLLLFRNSAEEPASVPLNLVKRIERIEAAQVQTLAGQRIMQYGGVNLPLFTLGDVANVASFDLSGELVVLISQVSNREVGVLAQGPLDVVEAALIQEQTHLRQDGILGSIIINGVSTILVDIFELVECAKPDWAAERKDQSPTKTTDAGLITILLAEDSEFFRNQVTRFLEGDGYKVLPTEDGEFAWECLLKNADQVNLVVTDIEMPRLNGLELTRRIRSESRFSQLPIVGLTSLAADEDIVRGKTAGINEYLIKLDKENLLKSIGRLVSEIRK